jgi:hypothetical protein
MAVHDDYYGPAELRSEYRRGFVDRAGFRTLAGQLHDWSGSVEAARFRISIALKAKRSLRQSLASAATDNWSTDIQVEHRSAADRHVDDCVATYRESRRVLAKLRLRQRGVRLSRPDSRAAE